jgi:hypothetical protein
MSLCHLRFVCCLQELRAIEDEPTFCLLKNDIITSSLDIQRKSKTKAKAKHRTAADFVASSNSSSNMSYVTDVSSLLNDDDDEEEEKSEEDGDGDGDGGLVRSVASWQPRHHMHSKEDKAPGHHVSSISIIWMEYVGDNTLAVAYSNGGYSLWDLERAHLMIEVPAKDTGIILNPTHRHVWTSIDYVPINISINTSILTLSLSLYIYIYIYLQVSLARRVQSRKQSRHGLQ